MINQDFKTTQDLINAFPTEATCIKHLETLRWQGTIKSPFDSKSKVYKTKNGYKCKNTAKYFNVKTKTIFDNTKIKLQKWFIAVYLVSLCPSLSALELSTKINVSLKTAQLMLQKLSILKAKA